MFKALAFGLGVGAAVQAWRAFPPTAPVQGDSVAVVFVVGLVVAYLAGRSRRPAGASATATATAVASSSAVNSNTVQFLIAPGQGPRSAGVRYPSEEAPWIAGAGTVPALDADQLEGLDVSELIEDQHRDWDHDTLER